MIKNYLIKCLVSFVFTSTLIFSLAAHSQDLTPEQKQERCQNNKNRIAELEKELKIINEELSQTMEEKEIQDAKDRIIFLKKLKNKDHTRPFPKEETDELQRIRVRYGFNADECYLRKVKEDFPFYD